MSNETQGSQISTPLSPRKTITVGELLVVVVIVVLACFAFLFWAEARRQHAMMREKIDSENFVVNSLLMKAKNNLQEAKFQAEKMNYGLAKEYLDQVQDKLSAASKIAVTETQQASISSVSTTVTNAISEVKKASSKATSEIDKGLREIKGLTTDAATPEAEESDNPVENVAGQLTK